MMGMCKCGEEMVLARRGGVWLGNDMFPLYDNVSFWLGCPKRRWWNFWRHSRRVVNRRRG